MNIDLSKLKRSSKNEPIPGTFDGYTSRDCPNCHKEKLYKTKPCCGAKNGGFQCRCGYKEITP